MSLSAAFSYANTSPELCGLLDACARQKLNAWETSFVADMRIRRYEPTPKQWAAIRKIAAGTPNYEMIATAALNNLSEIVYRWLPDAKRVGNEAQARNPKRGDREPGSFSINLLTGKWADFATGQKGGDAISLAAFLFDLPQPEAARRVAAMVGIALEGAHE